MHRSILSAAGLITALVAAAPAAAQDRGGFAQAFGGLTMRDFASAPTFGGAVSVPTTDNLHVIVEGGRFSDLMSPTLATLIDFTPVDVRLSGLYGQAGVRIIAGPGRAARPYGEAAVGLARMSPSFSGINPEAEAIANTALQFLARTEPLVGLGAGVVLQGGPLVVDFGYRYTKLMSDNPVQSLLAGGDLGVNQFRVGIGFGF
jgi:hypothetical protein